MLGLWSDLVTTIVSAIGLTSPAMLVGLVLVCLPVAVHLLNRRPRKRIVFPTIALLAEASASQWRLFKLRRLLLLAMRCIVVVLIVLAFARPRWYASDDTSKHSMLGTTTALVIDTSASTAQHTGGAVAIDILRAKAHGILDEFTPGVDAVNIVYAAAAPRPAFAAATSDLDAIRAELEAIEPAAVRADIAGAILLANRLLRQSDRLGRIVVLSDLQATNWDAVHRDAPIVVISPDSLPPGNIALTNPTHHGRNTIVGRPARLDVTVANYNPGPRTVRVDLTVDDTHADSRSVTVDPWQHRQVGFTTTLDRPGEHLAVFSIDADGDDGLEADNTAYLVVLAAQRLPIVVVTDQSSPGKDTATYFITRAMAPYGDQRDRYDVRCITGADVSDRAIRSAAAAIVSHAGKLSDRALSALHGFVNAGGGLMVFCGDGQVTSNLSELDKIGGNNLLPWLPGKIRADAPRRLDSAGGDWHAPLLNVRFDRTRSVGELRPGTRVPLRFEDGSPALAIRDAGAGRIVLANFSPAPDASDLAKHASFVVLMHSLVERLQSIAANTADGIVASPLSFTAHVPASHDGPPVTVYAPNGSVALGAAESPVAGGLRISITHPTSPGFYTARQGDLVLGSAAVNFDPRESDLRRFDRTTADNKGHIDMGNRTLLEATDTPLWAWCLAAAMVAMAVELLLVGLWKR